MPLAPDNFFVEFIVIFLDRVSTGSGSMKGLSRKKFSPCRQQFLAASHARTGNHWSSVTRPWHRAFNVARSHSS